ncbi:MAG: hypothetical protein H6667_11095 [Ardenticatenaceae bacterium]|nr:hypothetical protein [Ardenticatenaceae bacterium]MCB9444350.1 hypothetical protein [Ardenticatenaceae bacterium]
MKTPDFPLFNPIHINEEGISALETAIILIAFIVAAAVFAFSVLSAGTVSTERGKESVLSGLNEVQSAIELRGQIVAIGGTTGMTGTVESVLFTVANVLDGNPVPIDPTGVSAEKIVFRYRDETQQNPDLVWTVNWLINDGDILLENGELAEIMISNLDVQLTNPLGVNTQFTLEIVPPWGNTLALVRTTPPVIDQAFLLD